MHQRSRVHQDLRVWDMVQQIKGGMGQEAANGQRIKRGLGRQVGQRVKGSRKQQPGSLCLQGQLRTAPCMRQQLQQKR